MEFLELKQKAFTYNRRLKEEKTELHNLQMRFLKLRQLIPKEIRIPRPQEIPELMKGLTEAIWGKRL